MGSRASNHMPPGTKRPAPPRLVTHLDPCFRCALPDCDEDAPGCLRARVLTSAGRKHKARAPMSPEEAYVYRERQRDWQRAARERRTEGATP